MASQLQVSLQASFKTAANDVASFETNFFRITGTSEAETSVIGKNECFLAISEDKKSKLFGVTFSFKVHFTSMNFVVIVRFLFY